MSSSVMIVDDAVFMRTVLKGFLSEIGYNVVAEAGSGIEAMRKLHTAKPDLIFLDIILPDANGIELITSIKSEFPDAKIIICSSIAQDATVKKALELGAAAFIQKPFTPSGVASILSAVKR